MELYKYRTFDDLGRWRDILVYNRLYFASPGQLNDPFDCRPRVEAGSSDRVRWDYARSLADHLPPNSSATYRKKMIAGAFERIRDPDARRQTYYDLVDTYGVLSLASEPDISTLWAHYGGNHAGLCIGVAFEDGDIHPPIKGPCKVKYVDHRPAVDVTRSRSPEWREVDFENGLLTKSRDWAGEKEYRAFSIEGGPGAVAFRPHAITSVYMGARISDTNRDELFSVIRARMPRPAVHKMELDPNDYRLNAVPVRL